MKNRLTKRFWITALIVAVLVAITLSATIVSAIAKNVAAQPRSVEESALATPDNKGDKMINERIYATTHNRSRWLYDLITVSGKATLTDSGDAKKIFEAARNCGVISDYTEEDMVLPLTRFFVAQTTVRALNYKQRTPGHIADINSLQSAMATMAYYGYFLPDVNNMVYPDREITAEEYEGLLTQLERYRQLKGKVILAFGDSIMHGSGNNDEGIADMIAEKYGMTAHDYSVPGAAMGLWAIWRSPSSVSSCPSSTAQRKRRWIAVSAICLVRRCRWAAPERTALLPGTPGWLADACSLTWTSWS